MPVGVLISDGEGRVCQANEEVSRICKSAELIEADAYGKVLDWWDARGQLLKDRGGPVDRALQGTASHNERLQLRCVDGTAKSVSVSASPLRGIDKQIVGAVIVIQDVSEPKRIEAELEGRITRLVSLGVELEQSVRRPEPS